MTPSAESAIYVAPIEPCIYCGTPKPINAACICPTAEERRKEFEELRRKALEGDDGE